MSKGNAHITNDPQSASKRANLAAASAAAAKKAGAGSKGADGAGKAAGKGGKGSKGGKPTEAELTAFAQELDNDLRMQARTNFKRGLIASVIAVAVIVALIFAAKAFLGSPM